MAATLSTTMSLLNPKPKPIIPTKPTKPISLQTLTKPAVNQIDKIRTKGVAIGLGLASSTGLFVTPYANAGELADVAEAAAAAATNDNRGQLLLIVIAPAILWVLYNILQPALNQINKMRN